MSKKTVLEVVEKAADDIAFFSQLATNCAIALKDYDLTWEERAALGCGDVSWIESHIGKKLDGRLVEKVCIPLLSREMW